MEKNDKEIFFLVERSLNSNSEKLHNQLSNFIPEQQIPEQQIPEQQILEQQILEQQIPEQQIPEQQILEQQIPEQQIPEQQILEQQILEQQIPEQKKNLLGKMSDFIVSEEGDYLLKQTGRLGKKAVKSVFKVYENKKIKEEERQNSNLNINNQILDEQHQELNSYFNNSPKNGQFKDKKKFIKKILPNLNTNNQPLNKKQQGTYIVRQKTLPTTKKTPLRVIKPVRKNLPIRQFSRRTTFPIMNFKRF
ncbi:hypothetical protein [Candidatus Phytoplasma sacchari]|uniref:Uncharacterized protein n=1 Tax=Candidatus Phytoplasma sacchari TaxID=2609813 RepID=A0ABY7M1C9_9MOLU|nr:hypothetical protein O7R10_00415 [Candidatus Phytoplasma sacchari]